MRRAGNRRNRLITLRIRGTARTRRRMPMRLRTAVRSLEERLR